MHNSQMDKFEKRRIQLRKLIDEKYNGVDAALAAATGIDPSYMSRLLYPVGKLQKKNITEHQKEKIEAVHPGSLSDYDFLTDEERKILSIHDQLPIEMRPIFLAQMEGFLAAVVQNKKPSDL